MNAPQWSLKGKRCLVTGATNGIGRAAARMLAQSGAEIIIGGRSAERCTPVQKEIEELTGRPAERFLCDFSSLQNVREAAHAYLDSGKELHALVNNAGVFLTRPELSGDGHELTFAVNHLAPFLLTGLLLPRLLEAAPARIVNVSSDAHRFCRKLDFNDLHAQKSFRGFQVYGRSKGCNILFTRQLAAALKKAPVTVNAMHPGGVQTGLGGMDQRIGAVGRFLLRLIFRTPAQGADTIVWLVQEPALQQSSGGYYKNRKPRRPRPWAMEPDSAKRLWELSEELCDFRWPEISETA